MNTHRERKGKFGAGEKTNDFIYEQMVYANKMNVIFRLQSSSLGH